MSEKTSETSEKKRSEKETRGRRKKETSGRSEKEMSDSRAEKETSGRNEKEMSGRSEQKTSVSSEKERSEKELSGRSEKEMSEGSEKEMSRSEKKDQEKLSRRDDRRRWVFDEEDQKRVTEACHDEKLGGGHFGRDKTLQKACSRFYWHDMTNDIKEHIRTCDTCQRTNKKLSKASVRSEVWHQVGIDLVGPLTLTRANELAFNPAEDDDDFETTGLNSEAGEYALNKDLIVEHWLTHRAYNKEAPLRDFCGGQFVIINENLSEEFDHFRKHDINGSFYPVESLQLLECWFKSSGISIKTIIRYGKRYFLMSAANIDAFCQ
eukprot:Em0002g1311a